MDKKKWLIFIAFLLAILAVSAVVAKAQKAAAHARRELEDMSVLVEAQKARIANLTAERDACKAIAPACSATIPPAQPQIPVEEAFEPQEPEAMSRMDAMKKRYEEILVTYFVLQKCGRVKPTDYHVIISALAQEMASLNAPGRLQYDILTSAQGSYRELYAGNPCKDNVIVPLEQQYKVFIDAITTQFTPR